MTESEAKDLERRVQDKAVLWSHATRKIVVRQIETGVSDTAWDAAGVSRFSRRALAGVSDGTVRSHGDGIAFPPMKTAQAAASVRAWWRREASRGMDTNTNTALMTLVDVVTELSIHIDHLPIKNVDTEHIRSQLRKLQRALVTTELSDAVPPSSPECGLIGQHDAHEYFYGWPRERGVCGGTPALSGGS